MSITQEYINKLTYKIIGAAIEVQKHLGPGLLESVYLKCLVKEFSLQSLDYKTQVFNPIEYKGFSLDTDLRLDVLIEDQVIVEIKAIEALLPVHEAQLLTYMKLINKPKGILINFNCVNIFKGGQKTMVNELFAALPKG